MRAGCSRVTHPCAGRRQQYCYRRAAPRLACVRPAASVHPEPGSNSSLYIFYFSRASWRSVLSGLPARGLTLSILLVSVLALLASLSVLSMNSIHPGSPRCPVPRLSQSPSSRTGLQRYCFFPNLQIFSHFFFRFFCISPVAAPAGDDRPPGRRPYGSPRCGTETAGMPPGTGMQRKCDRWKQQSRHRAQEGRKSVTGGSSRVATWLRNAARV